MGNDKGVAAGAVEARDSSVRAFVQERAADFDSPVRGAFSDGAGQ